MHFKSLGDVHQCNNYPAPENPLLTLFTCNPLRSVSSYEVTTDFYIIAFKKLRSGEIRYGKTRYDHESGSMYFFKPHQSIQMKDIALDGDGFEIWFHDDYLNGHPLHTEIKKYSYFNYELNEALHLSPKEQQIIWELYEKIAIEYHNNQDEFTREISFLGILNLSLNIPCVFTSGNSLTVLYFPAQRSLSSIKLWPPILKKGCYRKKDCLR